MSDQRTNPGKSIPVGAHVECIDGYAKGASGTVVREYELLGERHLVFEEANGGLRDVVERQLRTPSGKVQGTEGCSHPSPTSIDGYDETKAWWCDRCGALSWATDAGHQGPWTGPSLVERMGQRSLHSAGQEQTPEKLSSDALPCVFCERQLPELRAKLRLPKEAPTVQILATIDNLQKLVELHTANPKSLGCTLCGGVILADSEDWGPMCPDHYAETIRALAPEAWNEAVEACIAIVSEYQDERWREIARRMTAVKRMADGKDKP